MKSAIFPLIDKPEQTINMLSSIRKRISRYTIRVILFCLFVLPAQLIFAQDLAKSARSVLDNTLVMTMLFIIVILLLLIFILSNVVRSSMDIYRQKQKDNSSIKTTIITVLFLLGGSQLMAQADPVKEEVIGGVSKSTFYIMAAVIGVELLVIFALLFQTRSLLGIKNKWVDWVPQPGQETERKASINWWEKFNRFRPVEQEANIDLGHNYDGIRELDNRLPPWWLYGFYLTILFAGVYLWRMHVVHTAPTSDIEYANAVKVAEEQRQAYLKKSANNIDESSVKFLSAAADLDAGNKAFQTQCVACHGKAGEGGVGPNLTDDYWLHGGGVKEIFKTIKYGVPEKGMKKWSEDFSPMQIAQLTSYVKSLHGTNPPNGKEKQGELYTEEGTSSPAASAVGDTTKIGSK
jgi:cytochrome c oxidase cbb3-type subunit 3